MSETLAKPEETQTPTTTDSTVTSETPETNESRPEWLPEKFKSPEELAKAYGELETWRMKTKDEAVALFKEEVAQEQSAVANVPDDASKYEFKYDTSILPEGINFDAEAPDPMLDWWRDHCFQNKLPQEAF